MSEYQFYEFAAIDAPLSEEGLSYADSVSSRADVTPRRWKNVYNWSDFRGSVAKMMEFYDAHVYVTNWGTFRFALAFPPDCLDAEAVEPYLLGSWLCLEQGAGRHVLTWNGGTEEPQGWAEGEGVLDRLIPIREEFVRGDLRSLYLGWLASSNGWDDPDDDSDEIDSAHEPPVPPGLGSLTSAQRELAEQLMLDPDLLAAAAELDVPDVDRGLLLREALAAMGPGEMRAYLLRVAQGEAAHVAAELNRLARAAGPSPETPRRSLRQLCRAAERQCEARG